MALHVDRRWLANVLARVEDHPNQPAIEGQLSLTNREKQCLIVNGYEYKHGKVVDSGATQNWRCVKNTCNGTAKTSFGSMEELRLINEHVCRQSPNAFVRREVVARVKTAAMTEFGSSSSTIVASAKSNLEDEQLLSLPTDRGLQDRVLYKKKPVGGMSVDKSVQEIVWLDYFKQTERGEAFLIYDSRETEPGLPVIFIFVSPGGIRLLRENPRWAIDGTFYCSPPQFVQLYTVNVFRGESTLPCAYALLPDKTTETYKRMFRVLKNLELEPQSVMSDFETAAINAFDDVFENCAVDFCLFHLAKNAFANIQVRFDAVKKHLHAAYENDDARVLLRCLPALAFLPLVDVARSFDEIKGDLMSMQLFVELRLERNLKEYLDYFEKTYIRRRVRGVQAEGLFPIASWNCHVAALSGLPRTNNHIEGWHKGFNGRFRRAHMCLSQFIIRLKAEEEKTREMVVRARMNPAEVLRQSRRPEIEKREANLRALARQYQPEGRMEFLRAVQHHLAKVPVCAPS